MNHAELRPGIVTEIPISQIIRDEAQPRTTFRQKPLEDLAANIKERGILQPITVVPSGAREFMIKVGERRWRAGQLAGLKTVPCLLDTATGDTSDTLVDQLSENDLREGLDPMERATALQRLRDAGMGPKQISEHLAVHGIKMSRPAVSNTLRLLHLSESAQELVRTGKLKESYARLLLPYRDWPKLVDAVCSSILLEKYDYVDEDYVKQSIADSASRFGKEVCKADGCDKCACGVTVEDWSGKVTYCMDPDKLDAKRQAALETGGSKANAAAPKKPKEKDPTKVKPVKITENKDGVVALQRRKYDSYKNLANAKFDKSDCETCPHRHLASHGGSTEFADHHCFYVPCFENLARQQNRIDNRDGTIRELIDDQLLPVLIETAAREPVASVLAKPLLSYVAAQFPAMKVPRPDEYTWGVHAEPGNESAARSTKKGFRQLPWKLKRSNLTDFLSREIADADCDHLVEAVILALHMEQRRELAHYLSIDIDKVWDTEAAGEAYTKLFTKPEIVALIGDRYDPPDVPAGEWRDRLALEVTTPDIVRRLWRSPIANVRFDEFDDEPHCRECGCSQSDACELDDGPCGWAEAPGDDGLGLCTACSAKEKAA